MRKSRGLVLKQYLKPNLKTSILAVALDQGPPAFASALAAREVKSPVFKNVSWTVEWSWDHLMGVGLR